MKNKKLIDAVCTALKKLNRDGIKGWGLNMIYCDGIEFGELIEVAPEYGCNSETCFHSSHDPAAPVLKWIPPEGYRLYFIGEDGERKYFYIENGDEEYIIIKIDGGHYHDRLEWGDFEDVPAFILARLAE